MGLIDRPLTPSRGDINQWVEIQSSCSSDKAQWYSDDENSVIIKDGFFNDCAVFPPSNHEGLPIATPDEKQATDAQQLFSSSSSSASLSSDGDVEKVEVDKPKEEAGRRMGIRFRSLSSGIAKVASQIKKHAAIGSNIWLFAPATTGVGTLIFLFLLYRRAQRWRRQVQLESKQHLMLLIKEKDQKINQLLLQIAQLNGILSASRRVPVLRVS